MKLLVLLLLTSPLYAEPTIVEKLICKESGGNPKAISEEGAMGLIQVMPKTASMVHKELFDTDINKKELLDPYKNLAIGQAYLLNLLWMYKGDWERALTAYNAGPTRANRTPQSRYASDIMKGNPCNH